MSPLRLATNVGGVTGGAVRRVRESSAFLPVACRKPRVVLHWLLGARAAQFALLGLILFSSLVLPRVREPIVGVVVPEESVGDQLAGVFGAQSRADRIRARGLMVVDSVTWVTGAGLFLFLLLIHLPDAVTGSTSRARRREEKADALRDSAPLESVLLYRSAIALACDQTVEDELRRKIRELEAGVAGVRRAGADPEATVAMSDPDATVAANRIDDGTETPNVASASNAAADARAGGRGLVGGRYAVEAEIGRGANGVAFRGVDTVLERPVALKRLSSHPSSDDASAQRFKREARVLAQLNHPNIVQVYDLVEHDRSLWMVMELVDGGDMASYLDAAGPLSVERASFLTVQVARGLGAAHERSVIHRDLKPANILMAGADTPKVTDFGLAKLVGGSVHTVEGAIMGSPHYMSPEQAQGNAVDHRCDIYALGIILYRMIAGRVPFEGDFPTVLAQHVRKPPASLRKANAIPAGLDRLVLAMLSKRPDDRPDSMRDVAAALTRFASRTQPAQ